MDTITIKRGDSATLDVSFKDSAGANVNLTDSVVFFTVKRRVGDSDDDAVITKDIEDIETPASGKVEVVLSPTNTSELAGAYFYDIQLKDKDGNITSSDKGKLIVEKDITIRTTISA